jgi:hypothetical protein
LLIQNYLPISRRVPPASTSFKLILTNTGEAKATDVRIYFNWDAAIVKLDYRALSNVTVLEGGVGATDVLISFDRIVEGEEVQLTVSYAPSNTTDTLTLERENTATFSTATDNNPNLLLGSPEINVFTIHSVPGLSFTFTPGSEAFATPLEIRLSSNELEIQEFRLPLTIREEEQTPEPN